MDLHRRLLPLLLFCIGFCTFSSNAQDTIPWQKAVSFAVPPPFMTLFGFSFNETTGRWTRGAKAAILLRIPPDALKKPFFLEFDIEPFIEEGLVSVQRVTVLADTRVIALWQCRTPGKYKADIPAGCVKNGLLNLVFVMPDSYRMKGTENDPYIRTFGLFFKSVMMRPSVREEPSRTVPWIVRGKRKRIVRQKSVSVRPKQKKEAEKKAPSLNDSKKEVPVPAVKPEQEAKSVPGPEAKPEPQKETPSPEKKTEPQKETPSPEKKTEPQKETPSPEKKTEPIPPGMTVPEPAKAPPKILLPLIPEKEVFFSEDNDCLRLSGFSVPEKNGRWTHGSAAYLKLNLPSLKEMQLPALEFDVEPLPGTPMTVPIRINDNPVGVWQCSSRKVCKVLLGAVPREGGPVLLTFSIPEARIPEELKDIPGARKLGLLFRSVKLIPDGRKQAETTKLLLKADELEPCPIERYILPGKAGKMLLLKGWRILPDGSIVNTGRVAELCFTTRSDLPENVTAAALELEPCSGGHEKVRYLNLLCDGVPIDSIVCVKPERYRIPVDSRAGKAISIAIEVSGVPEDNCSGSFRLSRMILFCGPYNTPESKLEIEERRLDHEEEQRVKKGIID